MSLDLNTSTLNLALTHTSLFGLRLGLSPMDKNAVTQVNSLQPLITNVTICETAFPLQVTLHINKDFVHINKHFLSYISIQNISNIAVENMVQLYYNHQGSKKIGPLGHNGP